MRRKSLLKTASKQSLRILSRKAVYESHLIIGGFFYVGWGEADSEGGIVELGSEKVENRMGKWNIVRGK